MGAMADYHLEMMDYDPTGEEEPDVACKYCGTRNLCWVEVKGGWRLVTDKGEIHSCDEYHHQKER